MHTHLLHLRSLPKTWSALRARWLQGILGVFLREPLLDWQREGRLLKDARVGDSGGASGAEDYHIATKVCPLLPGVDSGASIF